MSKKEIVNVITIKTEESQNTIKGLKKEIADLKKSLDNAVIGSDEFEKASKDLAKAQNDLKTVLADGKKQTDNVEGSYNHLVSTMAELKKEWKATADEVKRNEIGQEIDRINTELKELDSSIGNYQRNVGDYANSFKEAFEEQQRATQNVRIGLDGLQKTASGLANGYAAVQGAMNLLNIENANFEKAMIKVQSAMAIAQGVGGMKDLIEGAGTLKVAFSSAITGVKGFITSLSGVKAAIASTGIGVLVVAIGALVANWDKLMGLIVKDKGEIEKLKTDFENLKADIKAKDEDFEFFIKLQEAAGKSRREILKAREEFTSLRFEQLNATYNEKADSLINHKTGFWGNLFGDDKLAELQSEVDEAKALRDAAYQAWQSASNAITLYDTEQGKESLDNAKEINERARQSLIDTKEEELAELKRIYEQEKALLIQNGIDTTLLTEEYLKKKKEIEDKYGGEIEIVKQTGVLEGLSEEYDLEEELFAASRERMVTINEEANKQMLEQVKAFGKQQTDEFKAEAEKQKAIKQIVTQSSLDIASDALGSLSSIIGEETAVGKAAAVAQTTIDTYQSAQAAYKSMVGIPVVGPALGIAAATAASLAGVANIKKILSVKTDSIGNGNVDTSTPSPAVSPNVNLSESMPVQYTRDLLTDSEMANINQEQKVYVTETDISNTQNKVKVAESNSSF